MFQTELFVLSSWLPSLHRPAHPESTTVRPGGLASSFLYLHLTLVAWVMLLTLHPCPVATLSFLWDHLLASHDQHQCSKQGPRRACPAPRPEVCPPPRRLLSIRPCPPTSPPSSCRTSGALPPQGLWVCPRELTHTTEGHFVLRVCQLPTCKMKSHLSVAATPTDSPLSGIGQIHCLM